MKTKEGILGVGIGAALLVALGAVSFLVRTGFAGLGQPRQIPVRQPAERRSVATAQPVDLPADFEEQCRSAGL